MADIGNTGIFPGSDLPIKEIDLDTAHATKQEVRQGQGVSLISKTDRLVTIDSRLIKEIATPGEVAGPALFHARKMGKHDIAYTLTDLDGKETSGFFTLIVNP